MELIRGLHNLRPRHRGCVATIGNFDGVHLGHQAVIGQLAEKADDMDLPAVVITFEPQPLEFFQRHEGKGAITFDPVSGKATGFETLCYQSRVMFAV